MTRNDSPTTPRTQRTHRHTDATSTRRRYLHGLGTAVGVGGLVAAGGPTGLGAAQTSGTTAADGPTGLAGREWELTWSDEFDGGSVDTGIWTFRTGGGCGENGTKGTCNWGNDEAQYYTDGDNARVEDGRLVIEAREEQASGPSATYDYTSSRMVTDGTASTQYGRVDVRAKLPIGQGIWPAIWMLPEGQWTWPDDGEIDIVEAVGHQPSTIHGTIHGSGYSGADGISASYELPGGTVADAYHVFSIVWDPDRIQWFVDGTKFHEATKAEVEEQGHTWPFDDSAFHVILNVAVGGSWPGYPDGTTDFPKQMEVDYVRFFEEGEGTGNEDPTCGGQPVDATASVDGRTVCDVNGDGLYRDVDANGEVTHADVQEFFSVQHRPAWKQPDTFDFNDNDVVGHGDVVALFEDVATSSI